MSDVEKYPNIRGGDTRETSGGLPRGGDKEKSPRWRVVLADGSGDSRRYSQNTDTFPRFLCEGRGWAKPHLLR